MLEFINKLEEDGLMIKDYSKLKSYLIKKSVFRYSLIYNKL